MKIGTPIAMDAVPTPAGRTFHSKYQKLYEQVSACAKEHALPVSFDDADEMKNCRHALRKIARKRGDFLSSSSAGNVLTAYFWIEPKEVIEELKSAKAGPR